MTFISLSNLVDDVSTIVARLDTRNGDHFQGEEDDISMWLENIDTKDYEDDDDDDDNSLSSTPSLGDRVAPTPKGLNKIPTVIFLRSHEYAERQKRKRNNNNNNNNDNNEPSYRPIKQRKQARHDGLSMSLRPTSSILFRNDDIDNNNNNNSDMSPSEQKYRQTPPAQRMKVLVAMAYGLESNDSLDFGIEALRFRKYSIKKANQPNQAICLQEFKRRRHEYGLRTNGATSSGLSKGQAVRFLQSNPISNQRCVEFIRKELHQRIVGISTNACVDVHCKHCHG